MLRIKLEALEHPTPNCLDYNDRKVFASTILWLEDQKIRQYKIEDRVDLRKVDDLEVWEKAYEKYKANIGIPNLLSSLEELSWLLSYAVKLEFLDAPEKYRDVDSEKIGQQQNVSAVPSIKSKSPFDDMDLNHKDFIAGVQLLANKLKVQHHPQHLLQLEAVARIVNERMSPVAQKNRQPIRGSAFPFEKGNDIVSSDDPNLDYPVRILRLLQIHGLRHLQTRINEAIVSIQLLTANPKTDTKLGKVGF